MSKRVASKANTLTRCGHGRLRIDCGFCVRDDEIERLRVKLDEIATEILDVTTPNFTVDIIDVSVLRTLALEIKKAD